MFIFMSYLWANTENEPFMLWKRGCTGPKFWNISYLEDTQKIIFHLILTCLIRLFLPWI